MKRTSFSTSSASRALEALLLVAALTAIACDNHLTVSPTMPELPNPATAIRTLTISGSLRAEEGSGRKATVLFDGEELAGARVTCSQAEGCARLELEAVARCTSGRHTISFQILRQSPKVVDYMAEGTVLVSRDGIHLGGVILDLGPTRAELRRGEAVTFEIELRD